MNNFVLPQIHGAVPPAVEVDPRGDQGGAADIARIACCQLTPVIADLAANMELSVQAINRALAAGADLVVLPELITSGYVFESAEEARSVAIDPDHPVFERWAEAVAGRSAVVVGGFCELGADGLLYNSAAVVDHTGVLAVYRKTHLWDTEKHFFTTGSEVPPVVDTAIGRIGLLICYDLEFPELTRSLALRGADLLAVPTNWPLVPRPDGERAPEVVIAMAAARVNRVAIACCDRAGMERGVAWTEGTTIIGPDGWVAAVPDDGGMAVADIDLASSRDKTLTPRSHLFDDRRPGLYAAVTELTNSSDRTVVST